MKLLVKNIGRIVGIETEGRLRRCGAEMDRLDTLEDAWLLTDGERIAAFGRMSDLGETDADRIVDAAGAQGGIELDQGFADELHASVLAAGQRVEDVGIEDEGAMDLAGIAQGRAESGVVVVAQIAAEPDQGFFLVHGWFVPPRRLKFQSWTTST